MSTAAPSWVVDQVQAADAEAAAWFAALAGEIGAQLVAPALGEPASVPVMAWVAGLAMRRPGQQVSLCRHLRARPLAPALWCAWAPGRACCRACVAGRRLLRGPAGDRCDACSRSVTSRVPVWLWAIALRCALGGSPPAPAGPTLLMIRLCGRCYGSGDDGQ